VTTTFFDGPVNVSCQELIDTGVSADKAICMDQRGDATCRAFEDCDGTNTQIYLPNGRRTTAHVIEAGADDTVRGESGPQGRAFSTDLFHGFHAAPSARCFTRGYVPWPLRGQ